MHSDLKIELAKAQNDYKYAHIAFWTEWDKYPIDVLKDRLHIARDRVKDLKIAIENDPTA